MKKLFCCLFTVLLLFSLCVPSLAAQISDMDITVTVNDDGSAVVSQVWQTDADEGTEFYMPFFTNGYLTLSDLSVRDTEREYAVADDWDPTATLTKKPIAADCCGRETAMSSASAFRGTAQTPTR